MNDTTIKINHIKLLDQIKDLIQACIKGDKHSQSRLYEQFAPKMFAVCMRYCKSREEAEDILQDGFVQVFKSLHTFRFAGSFEGWIRKIMVYCAIQHYRAKSKMYLMVDPEAIVGEHMCKEEILARIQKKELLEMIQALSPAYRLVFNLYVFEGMKHREIARHLGISEGTSKSNLFEAKKILQKAIANSLKVAKNY